MLEGPFESLVVPWVVSPVWFEVAPTGVAAFPELAPAGACSPSGPQAGGCPDEAGWAEDVEFKGGWTLGGNKRLLSKCRADSWGPAFRGI